MSTNQVIRAGWLTKKNVGASMLGDSWKTRYFILQKSGHLTYFANPPYEDGSAQNRKGQVHIGPRTQTEEIPKEKFQKSNVLKIASPHWKFRHNVRAEQSRQGDLYVQASTPEAATQWLTIIRSFTRRRRNCVIDEDSSVPLSENVQLDPSTIEMLHEVPEDTERVGAQKLAARGPKAFEVVTTEEKYLRDLKLCMSVYHDVMVKRLQKEKKKTAKGILSRLFGRKKTVAYSSDDLTAIFGQMPVLIKFSEQLLEDLVKCLPASVQSARKDDSVNTAFRSLDEKQMTDLCLKMSTVFIKYTPFMLFYQGYANNFDTSQATLRRLRKNETFKLFLEESRCKSDDLTLSDFLIKPIQRLLRYKLLLRDLLKLTDAFHADFEEINLAILKLEVVSASVDAVTSKHDHEKLNDRSSEQDIHKLIQKKQLLHSSSSRHLKQASSQRSLLSRNRSFADNGRAAHSRPSSSPAPKKPPPSMPVKSSPPPAPFTASKSSSSPGTRSNAKPKIDLSESPVDEKTTEPSSPSPLRSESTIEESVACMRLEEGEKVDDDEKVVEDPPVSSNENHNAEESSAKIVREVQDTVEAEKLSATTAVARTTTKISNSSQKKETSTSTVEDAVVSKPKAPIEVPKTDNASPLQKKVATEKKKKKKKNTDSSKKKRAKASSALPRTKSTDSDDSSSARVPEKMPVKISAPRKEKASANTRTTKPKATVDRRKEADGTIVEKWPDGRETRRCPSGDTYTKFEDGTVQISNKEGASRTTRPDGSWVQISPDGTEVRQFKNGTRTFKMPSGQSVVNYPDGSRVQTNVDGTIITLRTDGVQVANLPNGVVNTKYPDGHVVQIDPDGTKVERLVEGVIVTYTPGGIVIARFKDGRTVQRNCDGVKLETFPDGRIEQTSVCGRFVTVKTADGKVTTKRLKPGVLEGSAVDEILGKDE